MRVSLVERNESKVGVFYTNREGMYLKQNEENSIVKKPLPIERGVE